MLTKRVCTVSLISTLFASLTFARTIHVPADQPSIQAGIDIAVNGDTVLVAPGTYHENINFSGKAITLKSSGGSKVTIIDGSGLAPVVTFSSNEGIHSVVQGFTIQNGTSTFNSQYEGGGIFISFASPAVKNNIIQNNTACSSGAGISVYFGSPLIQGNIISNNSQTGCSGGGGGGIAVGGNGSAQIIGNTIQNNTWNNVGAGFGGGIYLNSSGGTLIQNNIIQGNNAGTWGAAISMLNDVSGTKIVQNVITGNTSPDDTGIYWLNPPAELVNNTLTDGRAATGSSTSVIVANSLGPSMVIANNVIVASSVSTNAIYCVEGGVPTPSNFYNNDVFNTKGPAYGGTCNDQTGSNGNLSANPSFASSGNFRLKPSSIAIDVGSNTAPDLPSADVAGNSRIVDGNGGPIATVDMGAYEFLPAFFTPRSLSFGSQTVNSSTTKTVKLTNAQNKVLNIASFSISTGYSLSGCTGAIPALGSCSLTITFQPQSTGTFKGTLLVTDDSRNSPQSLALSGTAH